MLFDFNKQPSDDQYEETVRVAKIAHITAILSPEMSATKISHQNFFFLFLGLAVWLTD